MPQTPAHQRPVRPRVSGGVPWWIWIILIVIGSGVGFSLIASSIPEDAEKLFDEAVAATEKGDSATLKKNTELLKNFPDRVSQQKYLEALNWLVMSRPLKAIPLLKEVAEDPAFRLRALNLMGGAYASATDRKTALEMFELVLKEDENADEARLNIARILVDCFAWEECLQHLNFLVERKFRLSTVLQLRADIRSDLGQFAEASSDYEQSIAADPADPTNGVKATRLVQCLTETGDYEKISEYVNDVDNPNVGAVADAEKHLAQDQLKEALDAMEMIRAQSPYDAAMNRAYARVMLKYNTPEKASEAVAALRPVLKLATRDVELFRPVVELARLAGDAELASVAQQNVDQLDELKKEFDATLAAVIRTRDNIDDRLALAAAAKELGRIEFARRVYEGLMGYYPEREFEFKQKMLSLLDAIPQLVSTGREEPPTLQERGLPVDDTEPPQLPPPTTNPGNP